VSPETQNREEPATAPRRAAMATLAQARADEIAAGLGDDFDYVELRPAETGLVMVQGRIGGDGAAFCLGEATVTRASVRLPSGEVGFSYALGRDRDKARLSALCDALWQNPATREPLERHVLTPIRARLDDERAAARERTDTTRVDFFTLVRGED
jgi:alpha-D-ribose 1-methylphosphonate 5-triphosphate synthase subunit PhnG